MACNRLLRPKSHKDTHLSTTLHIMQRSRLSWQTCTATPFFGRCRIYSPPDDKWAPPPVVIIITTDNWLQNAIWKGLKILETVLKMDNHTKNWRENAKNYRDPNLCQLKPGTVSISPAWFQQGHEVCSSPTKYGYQFVRNGSYLMLQNLSSCI